jgi:3',5'-nucleoside bisphosphate phosphatase
MDCIDLHTHSTYSDGLLSPADLVDLAKNTGLKAIALTDHDTMAGLGEAQDRGRALDIEVVPGVEISAGHQGRSIHVLAYYPGSTPELQQLLASVQESRLARNIKIMTNLNRLGIAASLADLIPYSRTGQTGRPHIARLLVDRGVVKTVDQAFERYLRRGGLAYSESFKVPVIEVIRTVSATGGLAVLAHPSHIEPALPKLLRTLIPAGLAGLEAYHPAHSPQMVRELLTIAADNGLLLTGGSDFHGGGHSGPLGTAGVASRIPYGLLLALKRRAASHTRKIAANQYHGG